jgi:hypothetical protein
MRDGHKADILSLKMKITRWKEVMKKLKLEESELGRKEKKLSEAIGKMFTSLLKEKDIKRFEDNDIDTLFNQDIEDELSLYEDRITLGKIADHEKELERQKEMKIMEKKKELERRKEAINRQKWQVQRKRNKKMKGDLMLCERKIDSLLKVMMISDPTMIEDTYNGLM